MMSEYEESSRKSRFFVRSIKFGKGNLKEDRCFSKRILRKLSKITETVGETMLRKDLSAHLKTKL